MLKVGLYENIQLTKVTKNDKGTLILGLKKLEQNLLAGLNDSSADSATVGNEQDVMVLTPYATAFGGEADTAENNLTKLKEIKDMLTHILLGYMTADKITGWNILHNTGVTPENLADKLTQQGTVDLIYANIVNQFIAMASPVTGPSSPLFRCLFIRTSKLKHFPTFRRKYLADNPFWEPMTVPAGQSKLKYTKWEMDNGYNNGNRVEQSTADTTSDITTTEDVFSS